MARNSWSMAACPACSWTWCRALATTRPLEVKTMTMNKQCDLLVVGSGAAGVATAITAKKRGLDVVVIEKEPVFGGTAALSGGVLWIPLGPHGRQQNPADTREAVRRYMVEETGAFYDEASVEAFID